MSTTYTIDPKRLDELKAATIHSGGHAPPNGKLEGCAMEWASYLCGLEWSDSPPCTDDRLAALVRRINGSIVDDEVRTEKMRRLVPLVVGTAADSDQVAALLDRLSVRRLREIVLPHADKWPDAVRDEVVSAIEGACDALEGNDAAARSAAESAARSAAWSAAESAAWSAAWSAEADLLIAELELIA